MKKTQRGTKIVWNFYNDIPEIDIIAGPLSSEWNKRIQKEIEIFEICLLYTSPSPRDRG